MFLKFIIENWDIWLSGIGTAFLVAILAKLFRAKTHRKKKNGSNDFDSKEINFKYGGVGCESTYSEKESQEDQIASSSRSISSKSKTKFGFGSHSLKIRPLKDTLISVKPKIKRNVNEDIEFKSGDDDIEQS